jgi:alpha-glucuronidase
MKMTIAHHGVLALVLTLDCCAWSAAAAATELKIVGGTAEKNDAGIALAVDELSAALTANSQKPVVAFLDPAAALPAGNLIVMGRPAQLAGQVWQPAKADGFRIQPLELPRRRAITVEGDQRGKMYGLLKLAERVRLGEDLWQVRMESLPAFPLRIFSEEGQLLDMPSMDYHSSQPPYVDEKQLRAEVDQVKQLLRHVAAEGYNAFALLHLNAEEYIDYRHLDKEIYPQNDPHRVRSPIFCKYLTELCDEAHRLHLEFYLQVYEFVYPPRMKDLYDLRVEGADIQRVLNARYKELFERVPLDGMIITATEQHPRCGYQAFQPWKTRTEAARIAAMYHNACKAAGGKSIFRLWLIAKEAVAFDEVANAAPDDVVFEMKNTGNDFYLCKPLNSAFTTDLPRKQPVLINFDAFGQYAGWSRLFAYMKRWGDHVRTSYDNGAIGINVWGAWAPGCINSEVEGYCWVGRWNTFRMSLRGFTPGQANTYLLSRLMWNPDERVSQITRDFAALHLGKENAEAGAEALLATEDPFVEQYVPGAKECYLKWSMIYVPRPSEMEHAFAACSLEDILASNARALGNVDRMEKAFARVDPAKTPDAKRYAEFKEGIDKTALYHRTFFAWREGWWRWRAGRDLKGDAKTANDAALKQVKTHLNKLFDQWQRYPEEAGHWCITFRYGKPDLPKNVPWGQNQSMEEVAQGF